MHYYCIKFQKKILWVGLCPLQTPSLTLPTTFKNSGSATNGEGKDKHKQREWRAKKGRKHREKETRKEIKNFFIPISLQYGTSKN